VAQTESLIGPKSQAMRRPLAAPHPGGERWLVPVGAYPIEFPHQPPLQWDWSASDKAGQAPGWIQRAVPFGRDHLPRFGYDPVVPGEPAAWGYYYEWRGLMAGPPPGGVPVPDRFTWPAWVPGWLHESEGELLWQAARNRRVLEMGRFHGLSTCCLAQSAGHVTSVDLLPAHWARTHLERLGLANRVDLREGSFDRVLPGLWRQNRGQQYDVIFIDGHHREEDVLADVLQAAPLAAPGCVWLFHDYGHDYWPGVQKAVDSLARRYSWRLAARVATLVLLTP